jgi:uncharacterized phage protein gp47/JayE
MPFDRPTLTEIKSRIKADIVASAGPQLRRSNFSILGAAQAGACHELYGALDSLSQDLLPATATGEALERHAFWWGLTRKPAAAANGLVSFAGASGVTVPEGVILRRADNVKFISLESAEITDGLASVRVEAREAGPDGNTDAGVVLALSTLISGVSATVQVGEGGLGGGADEETDTRLRARLSSKVQAKELGGSDDDFYNWTLEIAGVTRAWVYSLRFGAGTVGITFVMDDNASGPIPSQEDVDTVQAYLDGLRPTCCRPTVFAPTAAPLDFEISLTPDTDAVREAVEAELADLILRECEPESTLLISHIREAISLATGETDHTLASPVANVTAGSGEIITMGSVTWG